MDFVAKAIAKPVFAIAALYDTMFVVAVVNWRTCWLQREVELQHRFRKDLLINTE